MLKRTTKHQQTEPKTPIRTGNKTQKTNRKPELSQRKIFSALIIALSDGK
jgi:hypothetical protein